jgi:hypothetical protein
VFFPRFTLLSFYWKEKTIPLLRFSRVSDAKAEAIGFRVGVGGDGDEEDEEEKFTPFFEGPELFLVRFSVCFCWPGFLQASSLG